MRRGLSVLVLAITVGLVGCGSDGRLEVVAAKGKLQLRGRDGKLTPIAGARIMFHPIEKKERFPAFPVATTTKDGSFELGTYGTNDGAPEGKYVVTISWREKAKPKYAMGRPEVAYGRDKLGGVYLDRSTSKLRRTVAQGKELKIIVPAP